MKGSKHAKLGNKKGRPTYRTPSRIKAGNRNKRAETRTTAMKTQIGNLLYQL